MIERFTDFMTFVQTQANCFPALIAKLSKASNLLAVASYLHYIHNSVINISARKNMSKNVAKY